MVFANGSASKRKDCLRRSVADVVRRFRRVLDRLDAPLRQACCAEQLEDRRLLSTSLIISEFMAANSNTVYDEDGASSDWIEVYNASTASIDLAGYRLTDDAGDLNKWTFPSMVLPANGYLLVFASGKDRTNPAQTLHTNFELAGGGEYLGLIAPDDTVVHEYAPAFPAQIENVSYGVAVNVARQTLLTTSANVRVHVPQDDALGVTWTGLSFDDTGWTAGRTGVGYQGDPPLVEAEGLTGRMVITGGGTDGFINDIGEARAILNGTAPAGAFNITAETSAVHSVLNFGYGGNYGLPVPMPNGNYLADQFAMRITANVMIPAGNWTMQINSDTGFMLTLPGVSFLTRTGENFTGTPWNATTVPQDTFVHGAVRPGGITTVTFTAPAGGIASRLTLDAFDNVSLYDSFELMIGQGFTPTGYYLLTDSLYGWTLDTVGPGTLPYTNLITTDVSGGMRNQNASAYLRLPLGIEFPDQYDTINLRMRYDDGFAAYINGTLVASRNAPELLEWNSTATAERPAEQAVLFEDVTFPAAGLLNPGTNILAIHGLNLGASDEDFLIYPQVEVLRITLGTERYFQKATPNAINDQSGLTQRVADTAFSQNRGFHDSPFDLIISTVTEGAQIRYTTDGTIPTATTGSVYTGPIHINRTSTVRAAAFKAGFISTNVDTQTYLFVSDVLTQSANNQAPPDWPTSWGSNVVDYGMDPTVIAPSPAAAVLGSKMVFAAFAPATGMEPYITDGTAAGTVLLKDIFSGTGSSGAGAFVTVGNYVYFRAASASADHELWRTDGTAGGTVRVRDIRSGGGSYPNGLTTVGSVLFFAADDGASGYELWKSDSVTNTTSRVRDISGGSSYPSNLTNVNGTLYFTAYSSSTGWELYKSDGTEGGTVLVRDIRSGSSSSSPGRLTAVGSTLYFTADDGTTGYELWKSGGTSGTTVRVADINPGINGSYPNELVNVAGTLYFAAYTPAAGMELWRSDGTSGGTSLVKDIYPGAEGSSPKGLVAFNSMAYFSADEPVNGRELWRSAGTAGGTLLVRDIRPGTAGSKVEDLTILGSSLFFSADDGDKGIELWQSNGAIGNASLAAEVVSGDKGSSPSLLTAVGANLIFTTDEDDVNQRLRKYAPATGLATLSALPIERDAGLVKDDMLAIPTLSIVMKLGDLFDPSTGIYANPGRDAGDGEMWEKPMSLELINPDGSTGFQIDAGLRIRGGFSRSTSNPKHAFRVFFRSEYGDAKLNFPMFGPDGAESFDGFDLRTFQNYSWSFQGSSQGTFMRDMVNRDMQLAMDQPAERGDYYHLYINGVYWGIYNSCERPEASYGESYFGGRKEDYDVIKQSTDGGHYTFATDGNMEAWTSLWNQARGDMTSAANYQKILGNNPDGTRNPEYPVLVDIDNLIDYMLVIYYGGNLDAPLSNFLSNNRPNNYFAIRNRLSDDGFRFFVHDAEHTLLNVNEDRTGPYLTYAGIETSNPQYLFQLFGANPEFRLRVADRINKWFFNDGVLSPSGAAKLHTVRQQELSRAVYAESARWGDGKTEPARSRQQEWLTEINRILQSYFPTRTGIVFNQLRADGYYPSVSAPTFNQHGGEISSGFRLVINRPGISGVIYYTLDGTDPRATGGAATGILYSESIPLAGSTIVKARVFDNGVWSALTETSFSYNLSDLRITEIMYNPAPADGPAPDETIYSRGDFEYIEVLNVGTGSISLAGAYFSDGIDFHFPAVSLLPGQYGLVVRNQAAFEWRYGTSFLILGEFENDTALSDGGENVELRTAAGDKVLEFEYDDNWHSITDGDGFSLVAENPSAGRDSFDSASAWRPSHRRNGSPGAADEGYATGAIIVSELLANSTAADPGDWVEFYNTTSEAIDISGWFLSDSGTELMKYVIPEGTIIGARQYLVFTQAAHFGAAFIFDNIGESVRLSSNDGGQPGGFRIAETFGASDPNVTFGLYTKVTGNTDFVALLSATPGLPNGAARVGPVVISEMMYNPAAGGDEFIELRNISGSAVSLAGWKFTAGVTFTFPEPASLANGALGLVVGIDPAAFRSKYAIDAAVTIWGPYTGLLDDAGEAVELSRPGTPTDDITPYILIDRVKYQDASPWPNQPDGNGPSLVRLPVTAYGNDVGNWTYGPVGGTPGSDPARRTGNSSNNTHVLRLNSTGQMLQFFTSSNTGGTPSLQVPIGQYNTITFDLAGGNDTLIIDLTYGNPVPAGGVEYIGGTGTDTLRIDGKSGNDWIMAADGRVLVGSSFVRFTLVETIILNGGDGDDTLGVSGPISYNVTINGNAGNDRLLATGSSGDDSIRLTANQIFFGTGIATFGGFELYQVDGTQGSDTLTLPGSLAFNPTFNGGGGDDLLVIDGVLALQPFFNGGDGFDHIDFAGTAGNDSFTLDPARLLFGALAVGLNSINLVTIDGGDGADTLTINGLLPFEVQFAAGAGTDQFILNGTTAADTLSIEDGQILYGAHAILHDQVESLRFNGAGGDDHLVVGIGAVPVTYEGGAGVNRLTLLGTDSADTITLAPGLITAGPLSLTYLTVTQLQVDALGGDDIITIPGNLTVAQSYNLGDGNDTLRLLGTASVDTFTLAAGAIVRNGVSISFSGTELLRVDGDAGGDYINLPIKLPYAVEIDGNSGDDRVTLQGSAGPDELLIEPGAITAPGLSLQLLQMERLYFEGNAGDDHVTVRTDASWEVTFNGSAGNDRLTVLAADAGSSLSIASGQINGMAQPLFFGSVEDLRILGAAGNDSVTLPTPLPFIPFISLGEGNDSLNVNAGIWTFGPELTSGGAGLAIAASGATINLTCSTNLRSLSLASGAQLNLMADGTHLLRLAALTMDEGVLDLVNNDLIVGTDGSPAAMAAVEGLFHAGRNGGAWNGAGIIASGLAGQNLRTLAMMPNRDDAGQPILGTFAGQIVDAGSILFKTTWHGDLNLDGWVDGDDYFRLDLGFLSGESGWRGGDVNYSGGVDGDDFFLADSAFLQQTVILAPAAPLTPFAAVIPIAPASAILPAPLIGTGPTRPADDVFSDRQLEDWLSVL